MNIMRNEYVHLIFKKEISFKKKSGTRIQNKFLFYKINGELDDFLFKKNLPNALTTIVKKIIHNKQFRRLAQNIKYYGIEKMSYEGRHQRMGPGLPVYSISGIEVARRVVVKKIDYSIPKFKRCDHPRSVCFL